MAETAEELPVDEQEQKILELIFQQSSNWDIDTTPAPEKTGSHGNCMFSMTRTVTSTR